VSLLDEAANRDPRNRRERIQRHLAMDQRDRKFIAWAVLIVAAITWIGLGAP
jgi:type II secretory pathway component PulM